MLQSQTGLTSLSDGGEQRRFRRLFGALQSQTGLTSLSDYFEFIPKFTPMLLLQSQTGLTSLSDEANPLFKGQMANDANVFNGALSSCNPRRA